MVHGNVAADDVVMWRKTRLTQRLCRHVHTHRVSEIIVLHSCSQEYTVLTLKDTVLPNIWLMS